jgi:hypothetical protein
VFTKSVFLVSHVTCTCLCRSGARHFTVYFDCEILQELELNHNDDQSRAIAWDETNPCITDSTLVELRLLADDSRALQNLDV